MKPRMVLLIGILASLSLAATSPAWAQAQAPEAFQEPDLAARMAWLVERLESERVEQHVPGLAIAVVKDGEVVLATGLGERNIEQGLTVDEHTLFAIGSSTKAFTSTLIGMLVEEGVIAWDDPVSKHLTWFTLKDEERAERLTLRDALSHRTGYTRMGLLWAANRVSRERILRQVARAEPVAGHRERFIYNNVMFLAAAEAAAAAVGATWEELLAERLLGPLGMERATTDISEMQRDDNHALGYRWDEDGDSFYHMEQRNLTAVAPAGAINASAMEMTYWLRMQLAGGEFEGTRIVEPATLEATWSPQVPLGPNAAYALGWFVGNWNGHRVVQHGGNIDGFASTIAMLPDDGVGFVLLQNVTASPLQSSSMDLVWTALLGDADELAPASEAAGGEALSEEELGAFVGKYHFKLMDRDLTASIRDGRLALDVPGQTEYVLQWPDERGRWVFELTDEVEVAFNREDGRVASMTLYQAGMEFVLPRLDETAAPISLDELLALREASGEAPERFRLRGKARAVNQGVEGAVEIIVAGDRYAQHQEFEPFGWFRLGYDGQRVWSESVFSATLEPNKAQSEQIRHQHPRTLYGDWRSIYSDIRVVGEDEVGGERVYVVELSGEHAPTSTVFVSAGTGLVLRERITSIAIANIPLVSEIHYEDYQPLGGVMFPRRITTHNDAMGELILEFDSVELDPAVEDGDFARSGR